MEKYLVETNNLTKSFGKFTAVKDINLKIKKGVIYGFLGPNGAGKSTTIRMLLGLVNPTKGKVKVFGKSITKNRIDILKKVGSIVESPSYYGNLTAYENLYITKEILNVKKEEIKKALEIVGLSEEKNKKVKKFSLGMKQRLAIAQSILGNPELLILDEPTNGLDPSGIREIRCLIKNLAENFGMTVLISSHILSEIELIASEVGIINKGKLVFQGTIDELHKNSAEEIKVNVKPKEQAIKYFNSKGYKVDIRNEYIYLKNCLDPSSITRELVMNDLDVYHISRYKSNLEEMFLSFTKKEGTNDINTF
ncbi:MAG: ABC transporter ATP-binding protein [Firmicutes bacterium]|nr:ABC transporter ATP-binding protein [Bacillota bacterium]